jgi:hypothetical protein
MATEVQKLKDLNYDEVSALSVIEKDEDLNEIFTDEVKMSFNLLRTLSEEGKLSQDTQDFIRQLFDKVILTKTTLINKYVLFAQANGKTIQTINLIEPEEEPEVEEEEPEVEEEEIEEEEEEEIEVKTSEDTEAKGTKKLPRRYGKANILKDIEAQGGKPTSAQLTALAINELKNIYVNLNARMVNDLLTDTPKLTVEDYRDIRATITITKNKLKTILKKK